MIRSQVGFYVLTCEKQNNTPIPEQVLTFLGYSKVSVLKKLPFLEVKGSNLTLDLEREYLYVCGALSLV